MAVTALETREAGGQLADVTAVSLREAYEAGRRARLGGRACDPPHDDATEAHAWRAGWLAADEQIFSQWWA